MMKKLLIPVLIAAMLFACACGGGTSKPEDFTIEDGELKAYTGKAKDVVIPDGVIRIGQDAFRKKNVRSVVIPDSCVYIGYRAFQGSKLRSLTLPDNGIYIGRSSFAFCEDLPAETVIPASAELGSHSFEATKVTPAPEGVSMNGVSVTPTTVTLSRLRVDDGVLTATFRQPCGRTLPVVFGADGKATVDLSPKFSVSVKTADGSVLSPASVEAFYDELNNDYRYVFTFSTDAIPESVTASTYSTTAVFDGVTWIGRK